ncbi:MAG TPA: alpha/beta hydrolase [Polyangiaceae bacterium]
MGSSFQVTLVAAWLLLSGGVLSLLFTINGLRPSRNARALVVSFAASMITLELAGHHLAWQAIVSGVLVWLGALDHAVGKVGLSLSLVSWAGLLLMVVQGSRTRGIMHNTLQAYVQDWSGPRVPFIQLLAPFPFRRGGIVIERDVVYRRVAGRRLKLDVYRPVTTSASRPAIVQIHGGAWVVGDKRDQGVPLCAHLARNGWVAFNVNYRLSPGATFPDHLVDLKHAIAWIRSHAQEYGVDPSFIAVTGGSAGGHLAALVALTAHDSRYQPGFEEADTSVQAAVPLYGVYDFTNRFQTMPRVFSSRLLQAHVIKARFDEEPDKFSEASPIDRIHPDSPPFLIIHGDRDTLAPLRDAREFAAALAKISRSIVLFVELKGAQHAFDIFTSPRSAPVIEAVERFLWETRRRTLAERGSHPERASPNP